MGGTSRSQTISTKLQGIAEQAKAQDYPLRIALKSVGQQSYTPNEVSLVWLCIGDEFMPTEEPYE
jgi:hypothetical protein